MSENKPTPSVVEEKLLTIFQKYTRFSREELLEGKPLSDAADSLTMLEIIFEVEEEFSVKIDDEEIPKLKAFSDVLKGVETLLSGNK